MSGHNKWSTIKHKKGAADAKRSKIFSKLVKEIQVAVKEGGPDPDHNARLRLVIQNAKGVSMLKDNIERAIKKGTGELEGVHYEDLIYEGYGPGGVAMMLEVLTDNKNRTVADVRHVFSKHNGNLGETGCVSWMFEKKGDIMIEEAYAATKWISTNGKTIHVDSSRLAVAGDSGGGNMVAAVTLLAKQRGGPPIHFQVLFYPVTDAAFDTPSYQQFAQCYFLTRQSMKWFWDQYAPDVAIRMQATASPLRATIDQLRGLPPALVITGECDVLRDEGEAYARKLIQAGVQVTALRYLGTIHDFVMLNAITNTPAERSAIAQANGALHEVFTK